MPHAWRIKRRLAFEAPPMRQRLGHGFGDAAAVLIEFRAVISPWRLPFANGQRNREIADELRVKGFVIGHVLILF
jgi:hypothetical protein